MLVAFYKVFNKRFMYQHPRKWFGLWLLVIQIRAQLGSLPNGTAEQSQMCSQNPAFRSICWVTVIRGPTMALSLAHLKYDVAADRLLPAICVLGKLELKGTSSMLEPMFLLEVKKSWQIFIQSDMDSGIKPWSPCRMSSSGSERRKTEKSVVQYWQRAVMLENGLASTMQHY